MPIYKIPDKFFASPGPVIMDYLGSPGGGLRYRVTGEQAVEQTAAFGGNARNVWNTVSLLSPHVLGWEAGPADTLELVAVDLEARTVEVAAKKT